MTDLIPQVRPTRYEVSCLPDDHPDRDIYTVNVEYRGHSRWAVLGRAGRCYDEHGVPSYESIPSERTEEWLASHRFDLVAALAIARQVAPRLTVNGWTVADRLAAEEADA